MNDYTGTRTISAKLDEFYNSIFANAPARIKRQEAEMQQAWRSTGAVPGCIAERLDTIESIRPGRNFVNFTKAIQIVDAEL